jgi:hypothetical protein
MIGQRFDRFTVSACAAWDQSMPRWQQKQKIWRVTCDCGTVCFHTTGRLLSGRTRSCGCLVRETTAARNLVHGEAPRGRPSPEYRIWLSMKDRCHNPKNPGHRNYGTRGITVCNRWRNSFEAFLEDMGRRPSPKHSLDRIDNDSEYSLENCRWTTRSIQRRNSRNILRVRVGGKVVCLKDACGLRGVPIIWCETVFSVAGLLRGR